LIRLVRQILDLGYKRLTKLLAYLQGKLNPLKYAVMNTKSMIKSGMEVMDAIQLSKIKGGKEVEVIINGKKSLVSTKNSI